MTGGAPPHRVLTAVDLSGEDLTARTREAVGDVPGIRLRWEPWDGGRDLLIQWTGPDREGGAAALDRAVEAAISALGRARLGARGGDHVKMVAGALGDGGISLGLAESCTGGLVAQRLTDRPGSSTYFVGGVVAYHDRLKTELLGVPPETISRFGAVSEEVAMAMAAGAADRLGSEAALAVTGIAGPGGGSPTKPVGLVWLAVTVGGELRTRREIFGGGRGAVRWAAGEVALDLLLRHPALR